MQSFSVFSGKSILNLLKKKKNSLTVANSRLGKETIDIFAATENIIS